MLKHVKKFNLESIVAKRRNSPCQPGKRSDAWLKYKVHLTDDFFIGGFRPGNSIDSILVGQFSGKQLVFAGEVHGGLNKYNRKELAAKLIKVIDASCPFANLPEKRRDRWGEGITKEDMDRYVWVRPEIFVRIGYTEWNWDQKLRHPRFIGFSKVE